MTAITADNLSRAALRLSASIVWPLALLAAAWISVEYVTTIPAAIDHLLPYLPYAVAAFGMIVGWHFNRSRLVFSLIGVSIGHWLLTGPVRAAKFGSPDQAGYLAFAVLFPVGLIGLSMLKERGFLTRHGLIRAGVLSGVFIVVTAIASSNLWLASNVADALRGGTATFLTMDVPLLGNEWLRTTKLPDLSVLAFMAAFAFFIGRLIVLNYPPLESGALGALVASAAAMHLVGDVQTTSFFFTAATLILVVAAGQDIYRLAFVDDLTSLPGRRALNMETMKLGQRYSIAMLDIDHFKKFNDTHGHDVGDQVLRMVAARMDRVTGGGKSFRYGGEEFTVLFPGKTRDEAVPHLDELRKSIADHPFSIRGKGRPRKKPDYPPKPIPSKKVKVTISIGIAERSDRNPDPETVLKAADKALYRAKDGGRNRVSV